MTNVRLKDELLARGYEYHELMLGEKKYRQYFKNGRLALTMASYYDYPFVSPTAKRVSKDKALSYEYVAANDVIIPSTMRSTDPAALTNFLRQYTKVIVKPAALGGGVGLMTGITDVSMLIDAVARAARPGSDPLIQEQFDGEEIRLTVIAGKVVSAIYREASCVTGDGVTTLADLLAAENHARESLVFPLLSYPQLTPSSIGSEPFVSDAVPKKGERVRLGTASMIRDGASFHGVTDSVHPSFKAIAEKLARSLNPAYLIVDFMVKDYREPARQGNYIFLEFNTAPALQIYSSLRSGDDQTSVIAKMADRVDAYDGASII